MSVTLLTKGMVAQATTTICNLGTMGELSVDILQENYNIVIEY